MYKTSAIFGPVSNANLNVLRCSHIDNNVTTSESLYFLGVPKSVELLVLSRNFLEVPWDDRMQ